MITVRALPRTTHRQHHHHRFAREEPPSLTPTLLSDRGSTCWAVPSGADAGRRSFRQRGPHRSCRFCCGCPSEAPARAHPFQLTSKRTLCDTGARVRVSFHLGPKTEFSSPACLAVQVFFVTFLGPRNRFFIYFFSRMLSSAVGNGRLEAQKSNLKLEAGCLSQLYARYSLSLDEWVSTSELYWWEWE